MDPASWVSLKSVHFSPSPLLQPGPPCCPFVPGPLHVGHSWPLASTQLLFPYFPGILAPAPEWSLKANSSVASCCHRDETQTSIVGYMPSTTWPPPSSPADSSPVNTCRFSVPSAHLPLSPVGLHMCCFSTWNPTLLLREPFTSSQTHCTCSYKFSVCFLG